MKNFAFAFVSLSLLSLAAACDQTPCADDATCDDHVYCNGIERCSPDDPTADPQGCIPGLACDYTCDEGLAACAAAPENRKSPSCPSGDGRPTYASVCKVPVCTSDLDCGDGIFCNGAETCQPGSPGAALDGCVPASSACTSIQICDETSGRCQTQCEVSGDIDGDGSDSPECGGSDCDDLDARRYPGATEVCDPFNVDEDCDSTSFGIRDADGDGDTDWQCQNGLYQGDDCNDSIAAVHPSAPELCNGVDDDCDGAVDEGVLVSLYPDADLDGFGEHGAVPQIACPGTPGLASNDLDCDDHNASVYPGQIVCVLQDTTKYAFCNEDGTTTQGFCPAQGLCVTQPGGFGICL